MKSSSTSRIANDLKDASWADGGRRAFIAGVVGQCAVGLGLAACGGSSSSEQSSGDTSAPPPSVPPPAPPPPSAPPPSVPVPPEFPLHVEPGKRYLVDAAGNPFLVHGDTAWSIVGQLTDSEIDHYLQDRYAKRFTAILFSAPEAYYTSQTPSYRNADGITPFVSMTDFTSPVEAYWRRVDHVVSGARSRGMACVINPAYLGAIGDGWLDAVTQASDAALQAYGAWLAKRYTQGNIIWCLGGDRDEAVAIAKQWNIVVGMRTVTQNAITMAHALADTSNADDAYTYWHGYDGFNLNSVYGWEQSGFHVNTLCAQAYARQMPFLFFEGQYENEGTPRVDLAQLRRQSYGALLSGACGQFFGNNPIWHFESDRHPFNYPGTWESNLDSPGSVQQTHVGALFNAYAWWKLVPSTDSRVVTSDLGAGANRLYPAIADDATFAMVYVPRAQTVSVDMSALRSERVRARLYDPLTGTFAAVAGSPLSNQGTSAIQTPGERVIVLDESR